MSSKVLDVKDLCKTYVIDEYSNNVLQNVSLQHGGRRVRIHNGTFRFGKINTSLYSPDRFITEVSGGQLQRACLCRSLINSPKMIFADEPTGALNQKASMEVIKELVEANRAGTSIMMVTHSEKVASCSERVIYLVDGNIQGELTLGKMESDDDMPVRERKLRNWLQERDW